jgi:hypothetical protein
MCYGLAILHSKVSYLKAKEELWKLKYISPCQNIIFRKSSSRNQKPSRYYSNSITNLSSFNTSQKYHLFKNPHIKIRPIIIIVVVVVVIVVVVIIIIIT